LPDPRARSSARRRVAEPLRAARRPCTTLRRGPARIHHARIILFFATLFALIAPGAFAQRKPVLPQIDLPHPYYFREMYLPQLTSGPSSLTWSPDSQSVVYSMGGSLWRQKISDTTAYQLTDGAGYDYQPDWSPDGKSIVYCTYGRDAFELWLLDVDSGRTEQLTRGGAVNVEPRWSPDGKKIVFVSTAYNQRFHIFVGEFRGRKLVDVTRLTGETKSPLPRYYYSAYDMEISPVWSRDGQDLLFVSNRGHIHGTGGFWRMKAAPGAQAREIHYEETNWKARPDFAPDGSRIVYSSYLGRNWHQLWTLPATGGDPFPLTYGEFDITNVRWSLDGRRLAYISNESGNPCLWLQEAAGGRGQPLAIERREYLRPRFEISIEVLDEAGEAVPARISVTDSRGKFHAPDNAWIAADDGYDRGRAAFEAHYFAVEESFYSDGLLSAKTSKFRRFLMQPTYTVSVPAGTIVVEAMRGFAYQPTREAVLVLEQSGVQKVVIHLQRLDWNSPQEAQWLSADLHVHMNYGGAYRNDAKNLLAQAESEDLNIVNNLIVNKEQRFPDIVGFDRTSTTGSDGDALFLQGQEFHTSFWGHRGLLNIDDVLLPGYAGYPNTAAASLYPMNADVYDMAHARGALVGAVHPFDAVPDPFAVPAQRITDELPVDVALNKLDYMEIVGFNDHRSTASVWYRLLNLGFRIPAGAGTDAMANFASLRGPVGMNRVFVRMPGGLLDAKTFLEALQKGRTFATNGPLLEFSLGGAQIGDELQFAQAQDHVPFSAKLRSIVPVDHLEVVCNGKVAQTLNLDALRTSSDATGTVAMPESGWCVLRVSSDQAQYPVLDNYVYATTSPIYVSVGGQRARSPGDAQYFVAWIDRVTEATAEYPDWNSADEKKYVLGRLAEAKKIYAALEQ
jgi:TolB protein